MVSQFHRLPGRLVRLEVVQADNVLAATPHVLVVAAVQVAPVVAALQVVLVVAAVRAVLVAATVRAASAARRAEPVVGVVVAIKTNCSPNSPHIRLQMHLFPRASSSSSEAYRRKSSPRSSTAPQPM